MANHYGASPIVSNGLIFCTDGKDKHSNPANGSTITDLIKDKSGTVTNATLSGDYAPTFDGSGDRIDFSAHDDFNFGDGDFTIAIWWRYTGSNFNGYPYLLDMRGSGNVIVIYPIYTNKIEVYKYKDGTLDIEYAIWNKNFKNSKEAFKYLGKEQV